MFTINFYDSNNNILKSSEYEEGSKKSLIAPTLDINKPGYTISKWQYQIISYFNIDLSTYQVSRDLDLYPTFEPQSNTITLNLDGGELSNSSSRQ